LDNIKNNEIVFSLQKYYYYDPITFSFKLEEGEIDYNNTMDNPYYGFEYKRAETFENLV
jgi:hypothetical protein